MLPFLAVIVAAVCFGTTGTAQAFAPADAEPVSIGAARILVGGTLLALIAVGSRMRARGRAPRRPVLVPSNTPRRLPSWSLVLIGALGVLAYQPAFFAGTSSNGVAVGTVVALGSAPVLTGLLAWLVNRRPPGALWLVATLIALVGVVLISGILPGASLAPSGTDTGNAATATVDLGGLLSSIGAGAAYAVYTLASKSLLVRGLTPSSTMGAVFGLAAVFSLPVLLAGDASWLVTPRGLAPALWLGVVTTAVAYVLFGWGLARLPAATVATLTLVEPLTAALLGTLVLGEVLPLMSVTGLAVLAIGIVLLTLPRSVFTRPGPSPSA